MSAWYCETCGEDAPRECQCHDRALKIVERKHSMTFWDVVIMVAAFSIIGTLLYNAMGTL